MLNNCIFSNSFNCLPTYKLVDLTSYHFILIQIFKYNNLILANNKEKKNYFYVYCYNS